MSLFPGPIYRGEMPRLSLELPHPPHPVFCQRCGCSGDTRLIERWQEHDTDDKPEPVIVTLCRPCAELVIEEHPRLYRQLDEFEPWPGAMAICIDCRHRGGHPEECFGTRCMHPSARVNGGGGVSLIMPKPQRAHYYFGGGKGEWRTVYMGPVLSCAEHEPYPDGEDEA